MEKRIRPIIVFFGFLQGIRFPMKHFLLVITLLSTVLGYAKTVYIVPVQGMDHNKTFFDPYSYRDEIARPFYQLRNSLIQKGYQVVFTVNGENLTDATAVLSFNEINPILLRNLSKIPKEKCFLFAFEPPVILPKLYDAKLTQTFGKIFVMLDNFINNQTYFKLYYPQPIHSVIFPIPSFEEKKLCVLIGGYQNSSHPNEAYSNRRALVDFFKSNHPNDFDVFGRNWAPYQTQTVSNKWETIKKYKFCICYENMKDQQGYVTEKIFDGMLGGAVPIYFGASNIIDYVPKSCFIDRRDFSSLEELYQFIKNMDKSTYDSYLQAIREYFSSRQDRLFYIENFVETIQKAISNVDKPTEVQSNKQRFHRPHRNGI